MLKTSLVVTPTYNEAENIVRLIDSVLSLPSRFELLVVDDTSPDGTAFKVKEHPEYQQRLHLLERPGKLGLGTAYGLGFRWALERAYPTILEMDADFSHDPLDLERLVQMAQEFDLVLGSRYMSGGGVIGWAKHRELLSRAANVYARWMTGIPLHDLTGGFKCYRRDALLALNFNRIRSEGYAFQIETTFRVFQKKFRITEIPIVFRERQFGKSKISKQIVWEALWTVARLRFQSN